MYRLTVTNHGSVLYQREFPTKDEATVDAIRLVDRLWDDAYRRSDSEADNLAADSDYTPAHSGLLYAETTSCKCGHLTLTVEENS
jgi:hypothetical protein